jgi:hypothetical protein
MNLTILMAMRSFGGGEGNVEREELNGKSQITLGSVVVVQLDDDTTAFGIV